MIIKNWWLVSYQVYQHGKLSYAGDITACTDEKCFSSKNIDEFKKEKNKELLGECIIVSISNLGEATMYDFYGVKNG